MVESWSLDQGCGWVQPRGTEAGSVVVSGMGNRPDDAQHLRAWWSFPRGRGLAGIASIWEPSECPTGMVEGSFAGAETAGTVALRPERARVWQVHWETRHQGDAVLGVGVGGQAWEKRVSVRFPFNSWQLLPVFTSVLSRFSRVNSLRPHGL